MASRAIRRYLLLVDGLKATEASMNRCQLLISLDVHGLAKKYSTPFP